MTSRGNNPVNVALSKEKTKLRKRYNKLVIIDLEKRAFLRNLIKQNTRCEHKQIYTQANAICRRISSSYEEDKIEKGQEAMTFEVTMANVSISNRMSNHQEEKDTPKNALENRYSESYWAEVI